MFPPGRLLITARPPDRADNLAESDSLKITYTEHYSAKGKQERDISAPEAHGVWRLWQSILRGVLQTFLDYLPLEHQRFEHLFVSLQVNEELKQYFRPEFLNRLDEIIVFRQLTKLEVKEIATIMLREVFERLAKKGIDLQVSCLESM
jgi:hypothetical protein